MESWKVLVSKITISKQKIIMMKRRKKLDLSLTPNKIIFKLCK